MVEVLVVLLIVALVGVVVYQRHMWRIGIDQSLAEVSARQDPKIRAALNRTPCSACGRSAGWSLARPNIRYKVDPRLYDCRNCGMRWDIGLYPPPEEGEG